MKNEELWMKDLFLDLSEHLLRVSVHFHVAPCFNDAAFRVQEEGGADGSDIGFSVVFLLSDDLELVVEGFMGIGNEIDAEPAALVELLVGGFVIDGYADHLDSDGAEILAESRERLGFQGTSGGIVRRIEIEDGPWRFGEYHLEALEFGDPVRVHDLVHSGSHGAFHKKVTPYYRFFRERCKKKDPRTS